jgi:hypothetical protein
MGVGGQRHAPSALPPGKGILLTYGNLIQPLLKSDKLPETFYEELRKFMTG